MTAAPLSPDESDRLRVLRAYSVLDTESEGAFDRLTGLASDILGEPVALVSLVDENRVWMKSHRGFDLAELPRDWTPCSHTILSDEVLVVPDATADARFAASPMVTGPTGLRFYAGAPLIAGSGHRLGALCVIDRMPRRDFDAGRAKLLAELAALVVDALELRRANRTLLELADLRRAKGMLEEAWLEAQFANRSKSEFLANVSHELRTPLNAIIGFSEVLMQELYGPLTSPKYKTYAKDIHDSGLYLLNIINDVLDVSKIEAGKLELDKDDIDLKEVASSCLRLVRSRIDSGSLMFKIDIPDDLPSIHADARALKQMIVNLLSNAVKFTPEGEVRLTAWREPSGDFVIRVADTGIGIAESDIAKVLSPFGQLASRYNRKPEGTGLGLPLVRLLTVAHGGKLEIDSAVGAGTAVTLRLPGLAALSAG